MVTLGQFSSRSARRREDREAIDPAALSTTVHCADVIVFLLGFIGTCGRRQVRQPDGHSLVVTSVATSLAITHLPNALIGPGRATAGNLQEIDQKWSGEARSSILGQLWVLPGEFRDWVAGRHAFDSVSGIKRLSGVGCHPRVWVAVSTAWGSAPPDNLVLGCHPQVVTQRVDQLTSVDHYSEPFPGHTVASEEPEAFRPREDPIPISMAHKRRLAPIPGPIPVGVVPRGQQSAESPGEVRACRASAPIIAIPRRLRENIS